MIARGKDPSDSRGRYNQTYFSSHPTSRWWHKYQIQMRVCNCGAGQVGSWSQALTGYNPLRWPRIYINACAPQTQTEVAEQNETIRPTRINNSARLFRVHLGNTSKQRNQLCLWYNWMITRDLSVLKEQARGMTVVWEAWVSIGKSQRDPFYWLSKIKKSLLILETTLAVLGSGLSIAWYPSHTPVSLQLLPIKTHVDGKRLNRQWRGILRVQLRKFFPLRTEIIGAVGLFRSQDI